MCSANKFYDKYFVNTYNYNDPSTWLRYTGYSIHSEISRNSLKTSINLKQIDMDKKRISDLEDRFIKNQEYISEFDSLDLTESNNNLSEDKYLITAKLHNKLLYAYKNKDNSKTSIDSPGILLLVFAKLDPEGKWNKDKTKKPDLF